MNLKSLGMRIVPYAMAIALFFLPFLQISCTDERMSSASVEDHSSSHPVMLTGMQLATGLLDHEPDATHASPATPDPFALAALIALLAGLALSVKPSRILSFSSAVAGIIALIALIFLKTSWESAMISPPASAEIFRCHFKPGFWGACLFTMSGIILSFMRLRSIIPSRKT